jgi:hypothetical protein
MKRTFRIGVLDKEYESALTFIKNEETDTWVCEMPNDMMEELFEMIEDKSMYQ